MGTTPGLRTQLLKFSSAVFLLCLVWWAGLKKNKKKKQESQELLEKDCFHLFNSQFYIYKKKVKLIKEVKEAKLNPGKELWTWQSNWLPKQT